MSSTSSSPRLVGYLAVAAGSALGGTARWLVAEWLANPAGGVPWATLGVNVAGSFLIGAYAARVAPGGPWSHGVRTRLFFMTGFCGGFTTFSMFTLETLGMLHASSWGLAGAYALGSPLAWLGAAWVGYALAQRNYGR